MADTQQLPLVGFIGLGNMGAPMARCLAAHGFELMVYDVNARAVDAFLATTPSRCVSHVSEIGGQCATIILMLPNGKIVHDALLAGGDASLAAQCRSGTVIVDMSSSAPMGTRELGETLAKRGVALLDAPVSGGVKRAIAGTLTIMVGGDKACASRLDRLFAAMGKTIHTGPLGSGHALKALNNYVSAAGLLAACEALEVAERFGIPSRTIVDTLNASTGKNNSTENKLNQFIVSRAFDSGFSLGLMRKDLETAFDLARDMKVDLPLGERLVECWARAERRFGAGADHTEIHRLVLEAEAKPTA